MGTDILNRLGDYLKNEINLTDDTWEIARYGLEVFLSTLGGIIAIVIVAVFLGVVPEALTALVAMALLRAFAGGAHCSSAVRCSLVGGLVIPSVGLLSRELLPYVLPYIDLFLGLILVVGLIATYLLAPVDSPEKPINTESHRRRLRRLSMIAVTAVVVLMYISSKLSLDINFIVVAGGMGLMWQCFVLTKPGHRFIAALDKGLAKLV